MDKQEAKYEHATYETIAGKLESAQIDLDLFLQALDVDIDISIQAVKLLLCKR